MLLTFAVMYGITFGIKDAKLFSRPRQWLADRSFFLYQLFSCPFCVGFHAGWITYLLMGTSTMPIYPGIIAYAFAGTAVSGICDTILTRIEADLAK